MAKGLAIEIVQSMRKPGDKGKQAEGDDSETEMDPGMESAAEELLAAVKKGDAKAVAEALQSFIEMC